MADADGDGEFGVDRILADIHGLVAQNTGGEVADYIPELSKMDPTPFGIAVTTVGGAVHGIGDTQAPFTIQSTSKAFTYCMALEAIGRAKVLERVGVEPSGDPFNAIEFDPVTRRPYNPMVNAGAITVAGILRDVHGDAAFDEVLARLSAAAGRRLVLDEAVYRSEAATGHRNRAIGHLLVSVGALAEPMEPALDLYFRQCSISVTARDLATMAATIANMGDQPVTGREVFDIAAVRDTQAVMFTCGMYDYSGNWAYDVGVPAKSGVGGGIMGVVNRQLGIGTFSPRLDRKGNSVRGVESFRLLSAELGLHAFDLTNPGSAFVDSFFAGAGRS
ncbi:glutaminase A [Chthonobacter albigriseus]|uniref:glutaminase A n=1 Tax=Chthonobacter albigriseus TaxID=1683161 RepID=UPI0015EFDB7C|nr:glutaminase A [Chthonobacter albigriseus]